MAVIFTPDPSAWLNESYSVSEEGAVSSAPDAACLSCRIETAVLEEGSRVIFPQHGGDFEVSIFLVASDGSGIEQIADRPVNVAAVTQALPFEFTHDYTAVILMVAGTSDASSGLAAYVSGDKVYITDKYFRK